MVRSISKDSMLFDKRILSTWIAGIVLGGGLNGYLVKALGGEEHFVSDRSIICLLLYLVYNDSSY